MQARDARQLLMEWYEGANRDLPWRRTRDPWAILLSEVMLQQTRVSVVIPYYERFLDRFPTPQGLAQAPEQEFLALWSGLGYYARARNLQKAARAIAERGGFPETYDQIAQLPGVGDYTAAAVASIAFQLPYAVLDGNVIRVISRFFAETGDVGTQPVRVRLKEFAQLLLDAKRPGQFNQALMELGATVCLPKNPQCLLCPWRDGCEARARGIEAQLPVKLKKRDPVKLSITALIVEKPTPQGPAILLRQRDAAESRLAGFWELPEERHLPQATKGERLGEFRHTITRHDYTVEVYRATVVKASRGFQWFTLKEITSLPLATMAAKAIALMARTPEPAEAIAARDAAATAGQTNLGSF